MGLLHELSVQREDLDPVCPTVAHVHQPVEARLGAVHRTLELRRRRRAVRVVPTSHAREFLVVRRIPVGAPGALELAGRRVEDHDPLVLITVRHKQLVGRGMVGELCHLPEVHHVIAVTSAPCFRIADLAEERAIGGEL